MSQAPQPYFTIETLPGRKVKLTNLTPEIENIVAWNWVFTGATPAASSLKNPPEIEYALDGVYEVKLEASSQDGATGTFTFLVVVKETPSLYMTILEMVLAELPGGLPITLLTFNELVRKWQLFYQKTFDILDDEVFNEVKWDSKFNLLIAKLILRDLFLRVLRGQILVSLPSTPTAQSAYILLSDYTLDFTGAVYPINIKSIQINDEVINNTTPFNTVAEIVTFLNSLKKGIWQITAGENLVSIKNKNTYQKLVYVDNESGEDVELLFPQLNQTIVNTFTSGTVLSGNTITGGTSNKGPLKSIETGPSTVEWYNSSEYWSKLLSGGVLAELDQELCFYAQNTWGLSFPFCKKFRKVTVFQVAKRKKPC